MESTSTLNKDCIPHQIGCVDATLEGQVFLTAGPRKSTENDTELGEDAGGLLMRSNVCYFWLADGTSENGHQEFTPRLLAQDLGVVFTGFVRKFDPAHKQQKIEEVLDSVLKETRERWYQRMQIARQNHLEKFDQEFTVSSVFTCGWLSSRRQLQVVTYGDTWLSYESNGSIHSLDTNQYRFFLRYTPSLVGSDSHAWKIDTTITHKYGNPRVVENVDALLCGSDGSSGIQNHLNTAMPKDLFSWLSQALCDSHSQTYDDKTLCFVRAV